MRDFLPEDVRRRDYVVGKIREVYDRYGFDPLETPAVENIDTLLGKYGEEGNQLIFKILKRGEHEASGQADLALRYDLTVPLARVVAEYQSKLPRFFKRYQIQPVWRADRPARGRFREFYQCDIDAIGSTSLIVEAELCAAASDVLTRLGFTDFTIRLNHRRLLTQALQVLFGLPPSAHAEALIALDKLDKIGFEAVADEFVQRSLLERNPALEALRKIDGFSGIATAPPSLRALRDAVPETSTIDPSQDIKKLEELRDAIMSAPSDLSLDPQPANDLIQILKLTRNTPAGGHVHFDSRLARGLSYYTGAIMEITVPDLVGSLGGGGRYDNLIGTFLGTDIPACGFSLGLERILVVMQERAMFPASISNVSLDYVVVATSDMSLQVAMEIAAQLRVRQRAEVYPDVVPTKKFEKVLKYVDIRKPRFIVSVDVNELQQTVVNVRDVANRTRIGTFTREGFFDTHVSADLKPIA